MKNRNSSRIPRASNEGWPRSSQSRLLRRKATGARHAHTRRFCPVRPLLCLSLVTAVIGLAVAPPALATDPAAPQIELVSPADGWGYYQGQQVQAAWGCFPGSLGWPVVTCEGDVPLGAFLDTSSVGTHSFTVHAVDYAGAEATVTHTYTVFDVIPPTATISAPANGAAYPVGMQLFASYSCDGFFSPLAAEPAFASFRAGDTVPVKFSLGGDHGLGFVARAAWRPCGVTTNDSSTAFGSLSYSPGPGRYTFMWQSDKSWAG